MIKILMINAYEIFPRYNRTNSVWLFIYAHPIVTINS